MTLVAANKHPLGYRLCALSCVVFSLLLCTVTASAQRGGSAPRALENAIALAQEADFASALKLFDAAEAGRGLSFEEAQRLYAERAVLFFAVGEHGKMRADLTRLSTLNPAFQMGRRVPPAVRDAFEELRSEASVLTLSVHGEPSASGVSLVAEVEGDPASVVRSVRIFVRDEGGYRLHEGGNVTLHGVRGAQYFAEAVGAGGAVIVREGSADEPLLWGVLSPGVQTEVPGPGDVLSDAKGDDGLSVWWWIGGGTALAATAAVVAIVATGSSSSSETRFSGPMVQP